MKKIMFNDAYGLTQATIEGRKTMTRRIEFDNFLQEEACDADRVVYHDGFVEFWWGETLVHQIITRYRLGEVVAVAQSYERIYEELWEINKYEASHYAAISEKPGWRNKMFVKAELMPHRIRITGIRAELLQDISDEDCIKEGVRVVLPDFAIQPTLYEVAGLLWPTPHEAFASLIDNVSGRGTWASNPWVVAYEYELVK